jgi:hypothetical protein
MSSRQFLFIRSFLLLLFFSLAPSICRRIKRHASATVRTYPPCAHSKNIQYNTLYAIKHKYSQPPVAFYIFLTKYPTVWIERICSRAAFETSTLGTYARVIYHRFDARVITTCYYTLFAVYSIRKCPSHKSLSDNERSYNTCWSCLVPIVIMFLLFFLDFFPSVSFLYANSRKIGR